MNKKLLLAALLLLSSIVSFSQRKMLDSLRKVLDSDIHDTIRIKILLQLANGYLSVVPDTALMYSEQGLEITNEKHLPKYTAQFLGAAGNAYLMKGDYDKSAAYIRRVIRQAEDTNSDFLKARGYNSYGILFLYKANYDSAIFYLRKQLDLDLGKDSLRITANAYGNMGIAYFYKTNYPMALEYQLRALHTRELITPVAREAIANSMLNIGEVSAKMEDHTKALEYYHRSMKLDDEPHHVATTEASIGKSHYALGNIDSAFYYQLHSLEIYKKTGIKTGIASNSHHLALLHNARKEWGKAMEQETTALALFQQLGNKRGIAESHQVLAEDNLMLGNASKAQTLALAGLKIAEEIKARDVQRDISRLLSRIAEARNDFRAAVTFRNRYDVLKDSIFSEDKTRQMANMEALYENDKKNAEIELLQQRAAVQNLTLGREKLTRNIIIGGAVVLAIILGLVWNRYRIKQRSNAALEKLSASLQTSLEEKELLLKEIHHRVKNNLQVISSLLSLQSRSETDSKVVEAMKEGQSRVKSMALIHQKLYQNEDISSISFLEYTRDLLDYLFKMYQHSQKNIRYNVEPFDLKLDVDTAVPLGLIMNELISNSLKYAFTDMKEGIINVAVKPLEDEGRVRLIVSDNGAGLPPDFDQEKVTSIGLRLVRSLSKQLQAELTTQNSNGLSYYIDFKTT